MEARMLEHSWRAEYEGPEIRIENHLTCERRYVDGRLVDERRGLLPPARPLAVAITSEDGTSSVVHAYLGYRAISSDAMSAVTAPARKERLGLMSAASLISLSRFCALAIAWSDPARGVGAGGCGWR
jgi:hypothetical protein